MGQFHTGWILGVSRGHRWYLTGALGRLWVDRAPLGDPGCGFLICPMAETGLKCISFGVKQQGRRWHAGQRPEAALQRKAEVQETVGAGLELGAPQTVTGVAKLWEKMKAREVKLGLLLSGLLRCTTWQLTKAGDGCSAPIREEPCPGETHGMDDFFSCNCSWQWEGHKQVQLWGGNLAMPIKSLKMTKTYPGMLLSFQSSVGNSDPPLQQRITTLHGLLHNHPNDIYSTFRRIRMNLICMLNKKAKHIKTLNTYKGNWKWHQNSNLDWVTHSFISHMFLNIKLWSRPAVFKLFDLKFPLYS